MLSWLLRPIEPSRFAFVWPPLLALFVLACAVAVAGFEPSIPPGGRDAPMWLAFGAVAWFAAAWLFVRHRRAGGRGLGYRTVSEICCATVLTIMALPSLIWPDVPDDAPATPAMKLTVRACWWVIGLIMAAFTYSVFSTTRSTQRPS